MSNEHLRFCSDGTAGGMIFAGLVGSDELDDLKDSYAFLFGVGHGNSLTRTHFDGDRYILYFAVGLHFLQ
jgi:hypothetical protein